MKMINQIKRFKIPLLIIGIIVITITAVILAFNLASFYLTRQYAATHEGCLPTSTHHKVIIKDGAVSPKNTVAHKCETLTITNLDTAQRIMAFGQHDHHVTYDGITEEHLIKNQSLTVTLLQTGDFKFHDHANDEVQGTFTVTQ
jgi:hypothetical protein